MHDALAANLDFINGTLATYFSRYPEKGLALTNELLRTSYEFGEMLAGDIKVEVKGGQKLIFDTLLRGGTQGGFTGPMQVREPRQSTHTVRGETDWTFYERSYLIDEIADIELQEVSVEKIFSVIEAKEEVMMTEAHNELEEVWFDPLGGALSQSVANPPMLGMKAWVTRDGHHVDGSNVVGGLNVVTDPRWLNKYCGPYGSNLNVSGAHVTTDAITSGNQLREKARKMARYLKMKAPAGLKFAKDDTKKSTMLRQQKIYVDEIGYDAFQATQDALGYGRDRLQPKELDNEEPHLRGIPVTWIDLLGVGSAGLPTGVHSSVADPGRGAFAAGGHANTGECYMLNMHNFKPVVKSGMNPKRKKMEFLPLHQALYQLIRWTLATVCNSRQRQGVIWGFAPVQRA